MKKILSVILLIMSLFALSCNNNKNSGSLSTGPIRKVGEIIVDPNGVTPLSAVYTTETVNIAPITVTVKGLYGEPDIIHTYPAGYGTEFEIHGMFPESENIITVNDGGRVITKNVTVGTISVNGITLQKKYDVAINNLPEETKYPNNPELYFTMNILSHSSMAVSKNGYVRYLQTGNTSAKLVIENKKMLLYSMSVPKNTDLLGKELIKYPTNPHHDTIKVNGNYIYLSFSTWGSEDRLVEIDSSGRKLREESFGKLIENTLDLKTYPEDEAVFKQIVFGEDVNNIYVLNGQQKAVDWFHGNSIVYDSSTDILYVSSRHRGVLAIDYSEWKLIWWMADETLATQVNENPSLVVGIPYNKHFKDLQSLEAYRVNGSGKDDGPKNQHALFLFANGNLGMFDNQGDENSSQNGSRYVEYNITGTHGNYIATKVYEYRDPSFYTRGLGDVDFVGENYQNLLLAYGNIGTIIEVNRNTHNILFRLYLPLGPYRADKMPLYYDEGRVYSEDCNLKNPN